MKKQINNSVSRRGFVAGTTALAGSLGFPAILGAQPAAVKVGLIHPVTGFVAYNGQQGRLGGTMAIEDINKAGGIKSMGGAKLEALLGDSQSKVEVGVAEVEKMNEQGVAAYIGCFQSPVAIAATQAAAKYNTPFLIDVGASDLIVNRGLKNTFRLKPGFGVCVDDGITSLGALNKAASNVAKTAVIVHESGEFGTGTAKLLQSKLPSIGIEAKEADRARQPDAQLRQHRAAHPLDRARHRHDVELRQRIHAAGAHALPAEGQCRGLLFDPGRRLQLQVRQGDARRLAVHDGREPLVQSQEREGPGAEEARRGGRRAVHLRGLSRLLRNVMLLADSLERAGSADKAKLTDALASSTFKAELMPYGPTKFVNGQNQGAKPAVMQSLKGDIEVIAPEEFASAKAVFPKPKL